MTALDNLRAVLAQAESEPDDAVAITTGFDASLQRQGLTWGDLRALVRELDEALDDARAQGRAQVWSAINAESAVMTPRGTA